MYRRDPKSLLQFHLQPADLFVERHLVIRPQSALAGRMLEDARCPVP